MRPPERRVDFNKIEKALFRTLTFGAGPGSGPGPGPIGSDLGPLGPILPHWAQFGPICWAQQKRRRQPQPARLVFKENVFCYICVYIYIYMIPARGPQTMKLHLGASCGGQRGRARQFFRRYFGLG